jgi:hypothetical protein
VGLFGWVFLIFFASFFLDVLFYILFVYLGAHYAFNDICRLLLKKNYYLCFMQV